MKFNIINFFQKIDYIMSGVKMAYKNQMLRQIASGKYSKRGYLNMINKKNSILANRAAKLLNEEVVKCEVVEDVVVDEVVEDVVVSEVEVDKAIVEESAPEVNVQVDSLETRIANLESYVVDVTMELDKLVDNQQKIIKVVDKLYLELSIIRNKISR